MSVIDIVMFSLQLAVIGGLLAWYTTLLLGHTRERADAGQADGTQGKMGWLFQILFGSLVCYFLCTMYYLLYMLITDEWPWNFSVADFSLLGMYALLLTAVRGLANLWSESENNLSHKYRFAAFAAPLVVIGFHIGYLFLYVIGHDSSLVDWLNNIAYCTVMSYLGYGALRSYLVSRASAGRFKRFYFCLLLYLFFELMIFLISAIFWDTLYYILVALEWPVLFGVFYMAKKGVADR